MDEKDGPEAFLRPLERIYPQALSCEEVIGEPKQGFSDSETRLIRTAIVEMLVYFGEIEKRADDDKNIYYRLNKNNREAE